MSNKIDLHGIKHEDVRRSLDRFFWDKMQNNHSEVEIVTGISIKMKEIVKGISNEYNFRVEEIILNPGILIVYIK